MIWIDDLSSKLQWVQICVGLDRVEMWPENSGMKAL